MNRPALVTSAVLTISFILLVGPFSMTLNVFAQGNTANSTQSQNDTGNKAAQSGGGNQPSQGIKVDDFPIEIKTGENSGNSP